MFQNPFMAPPPMPQVYFDFGVDGKPVGRVVVEVFTDAPLVGSQRFLDLAQGKEGVGYRRSKINFVQDVSLPAAAFSAGCYSAVLQGRGGVLEKGHLTQGRTL